MNDDSLAGRRIALLVEDFFDDAELVGARDTLVAHGAAVVIVGPLAGRSHTGLAGTAVSVERAGGEARAADFDAVVVPGGYAPDRLRLRHAVVDLVRDAVAAGKPVAAICRGPALLINAGVIRGRTVTCWPSIAVDLKNAGGRYVDRPVVVDGPVITARKADDLPFLLEALVAALRR
ncbi:MAG: DJ-1/PfpI/YhbO family deglycase/protease [Vicinamibacterales bacterium]